MKKQFAIIAVILFTAFAGASFAEGQQQVFGPATYEVKERYGKDNVYTESFRASEGTYIIKVQNGTQPSERPDFTELTVNGVKAMKEDIYEYPFIACFTALKKENTLELNIKDQKPAGMKRPALTRKLLIVTVLPAASRFPEGSFGLGSWDDLKDFTASVLKIRYPESAGLAVTAADIRIDTARRTEAMVKLSDKRDPDALLFIRHLEGDIWAKSELRAEAAFALGKMGDSASIVPLVNGLLDPDELVRIGAARGLSRFKEEETREPLTKMLERLDSMRVAAVLRAVVGAGWKPVGTLLDMAASSDTYTANLAIELVGNLKDPRVADFLLKTFEKPEGKSMAVIIRALGETKDKRAVEPLLAMARDAQKRKGAEAELGVALANLGDMRSAEVIKEMAMKAESRSAYIMLREAYLKLTGKNL